MGMTNAIIDMASREPIDVRRALEDAGGIKSDEKLANELVRIAIDADKTTINALLRAVMGIKNELWRARTLFSLFRRTDSKLTRMLPRTAQDIIFEIVQGIGSEQARFAALRNLSSDLPFELRNRLAALGETIADPLNRLQIAMQYETEPDSERIRFFLNTVKGIDEEGARGQALAI